MYKIYKIVLPTLMCSGLFAANSITDMFANGKASGQIREFSISRSVKYSDPTKEDYTRDANAIGGHLKFETAPYNGLKLGAAFYTTNGFLLDTPRTDYKKVDPTLFGKDNESYSILGEAYLEFSYDKTTFKGGRQKLNTPMMAPDDVRMITNLYEAYMLSSKSIQNTTLTLGHVRSFAQGTYARAKTSGTSAVTAGYSYVDAKNQVGSFENMGTYAVGERTKGVTLGAIEYDNSGLKLQLWDYYAYNILNTLYAQVDYRYKNLFAAVQYIKENDIGKKYLGDIESDFVGLRAGGTVANFTASLAYSMTSKNGAGDPSLKHAIVSMWGNMPSFTKGMVTRHAFLAGAKVTKADLSYDWKKFGVNLKTKFYALKADMGQYNGVTYGDATEVGFDFKYKPSFVKNLELRLRGNFPRDYKVAVDGSTQSWNEYRFIANYNF